MANLTAQQINELADNFSALAHAIGEYRSQNFNALTTQQKQMIEEFYKSILDYADNFYALSATLVMDDVQASLTTIGDITTQIKATFNTLQNVQKAINIAASVVTLGSSIFSKDPQKIANSIVELLDTCH
jgi:hypothetical protein